MNVLHMQSSPRGDRSNSIALTNAFLSASRKVVPEINEDVLNVWDEKLPEFDSAAIEAKYKGVAGTAMNDAETRVWNRIQSLVARFKRADRIVVGVPMWNFAYPYFSQTMAEFWRRWHISLSTWFRDYVYIALGGRQVSRWQRAFNVMITFLLSGFWHGAAWNFVFWGGLNGLAIFPETLRPAKQTLRADDIPAGDSLFPSLYTLTCMLNTFILTCILWTFFRARTLSDAFTILQRIGLDAFNLPAYRTMFASISSSCPIGRKVLLLVVAFVCLEWIQRKHPHPLTFHNLSRPVQWLIYTALLWAIIYWGTYSPVEFIYFQF